MSLPQARGYIRARAATVLDQEVAQLIEQAKSRPALVLAARDSAMEQTVRLAIGDLLQIARQPLAERRAA